MPTAKGATPSSAERFSDNPIGKVTKATAEAREQAAAYYAEYQANEARWKVIAEGARKKANI